MMRPDRSPEREVKYLEWRVRIFSVGAVIAVFGLYYDNAWIIWAALAVLLTGFLVRFMPQGGGEG
jgi:hypothetical protein